MVRGISSRVSSLQTYDVPSAGLLGKGRAQLARDAFKSICSSRRHSTIIVSKLATTVSSISSRDDDEISDRQRRSSRNMASTSGRTANAVDTADLHRGRAATNPPNSGRSRDRDVSPDASWTYAFASPTTKTRVARSRPGNGKSPAPGPQCMCCLAFWVATCICNACAVLQKKNCTREGDALTTEHRQA